MNTDNTKILEVEGVSKAFWGIRALDRVSLTVRRGEIHALTGENGAGKSTLMKIVAGIERGDSGEVRFHGRAIAMIHQELLPFPEMTVAENICMGAEPVRAFGWVDGAAMDRHARELLARLGVDVPPSRRMRDLSFAEQQSVEVAKALGRQAGSRITAKTRLCRHRSYPTRRGGREGGRAESVRLRRQAIGARQGIEHAVQHAMPGGIDMVGGRQQRHGMLLRPRNQRRIGLGQRQLPGRLGLRVHDLRHEP